MNNSKWRVIIGLVLVYIAVLMNWNWVWGVLFLIWVVPDLLIGVTHFMEIVDKRQNPVLYWIIIASWIWMSLFLVALDVAPTTLQHIFPAVSSSQTIGEYKDETIPPQIAATNASSTGVYQDQAIRPNARLRNIAGSIANTAGKTTDATSSAVEKVIDAASEVLKQDSLNYKTYRQKETQYFVGISSPMNFNDPDLEKNTEALWNYFIENDISQVISNIADERVYFLYSDSDNEGNYKASIAYRTKNLNSIYEGLEGITIAASTFAVFEQKESDPTDFISTTWEKIYTSDLDMAKGTSLEVYTFDKNYNIAKTEIRVPIN